MLSLDDILIIGAEYKFVEYEESTGYTRILMHVLRLGEMRGNLSGEPVTCPKYATVPDDPQLFTSER